MFQSTSDDSMTCITGCAVCHRTPVSSLGREFRSRTVVCQDTCRYSGSPWWHCQTLYLRTYISYIHGCFDVWTLLDLAASSDLDPRMTSVWMYPNSDQTVGRAPCLTDYHLPDYNVRPGSRRCLLTPVTSAKRHLLTVSRGPGIFLASGERLVLCPLSGLSSKTTNLPNIGTDTAGGTHGRCLCGL